MRSRAIDEIASFGGLPFDGFVATVVGYHTNDSQASLPVILPLDAVVVVEERVPMAQKQLFDVNSVERSEVMRN